MYMTGLIGTVQQLETANSGAGSAPGQVTGLTVTSTSSSQLSLSWSAVSGATIYKVERSLSSGSGFTQIASNLTTSYNNTGLSQGTRYYYRVRASNSNGDGSYSSVANNFTRPGQVTGLSATAASSSQINLSWNNPSGTETGYQVYRSTNSNMSGQTLIGSPTGTTFSTTGLSASTTYYFRVRAVNLGGTGSYSSIANATTQSGASAPTSVSIATSSSGNFNNAIIIGCDQESSAGDFLDVNSGSTFSSTAGTIGYTVNANYSSALNGNSGVLDYTIFGYIRATGATSFQWDVAFDTAIDSNNAWDSVGTTGTASTAQDRTSTNVGEKIRVVHSSGGRGYNLPAGSGNSSIDFAVEADATNSTGTTSATTLSVTLESN